MQLTLVGNQEGILRNSHSFACCSARASIVPALSAQSESQSCDPAGASEPAAAFFCLPPPPLAFRFLPGSAAFAPPRPA